MRSTATIAGDLDIAGVHALLDRLDGDEQGVCTVPGCHHLAHHEHPPNADRVLVGADLS